MCSVHHGLWDSSNHPLLPGFFEHFAIKLQPSFIFFCRPLNLLFIFFQCSRFCRRALWCSLCRILCNSTVNSWSGRTVHWECSWGILTTEPDELFWQHHPDATFPWSLAALLQLQWLHCMCIAWHVHTSICSPGKEVAGTRPHEWSVAASSFFCVCPWVLLRKAAMWADSPVLSSSFSKEQLGKCLCVGVCTQLESYLC